MMGNLCEWVFDWHPDYVDEFRLLRGGGWSTNTYYCRSGARYYLWPEYAHNSCGFRTVLSPGPQ